MCVIITNFMIEIYFEFIFQLKIIAIFIRNGSLQLLAIFF